MRVLAHAREGRYPMDDAAGIPRPLLAKYCLKGIGSQEGTFMMKPELRGRINFRQINLNAELPDIGQFDVIFLRNVMIYFDLETKRQVVRRVARRLKPGGLLLIGHAETLGDVAHGLHNDSPSVYRAPERTA
jgi:chemotaxis protein methyltransferase CheR